MEIRVIIAGMNEDDLYFKPPNKEEKHFKKRLQKKDRIVPRQTSKKNSPTSLSKPHDTGQVIAIGPGHVLLRRGGELIQSSLRGKLKKHFTAEKNLLAAGDLVRLDNDLLIAEVLPRRSVLQRKDNLSRKKNQTIAANADQCFITVSIQSPSLKPALIDRYLITCSMGNMIPIIVINKIDLLPDGDWQHCMRTYTRAGFTCVAASAKTLEGIESLKNLLAGKLSVFSGQSGVGKTSLINIVCETDFKTSEIVAQTQKGAHTTSAALIIPLKEGEGAVIDTPGIKSFALAKVDKTSLLDYYPDLQKFASRCKYPRCTHMHEPGCGVIAAIEAGELDPMRYESYSKIRESNDEDPVG